jgi:UDP-N-acetyl-D-mannosaminuronate dehydrogenase
MSSTGDAGQQNLKLAKEYMDISYSPERASADNVKHLVAENSKFIAPTTFPEIKDLLQYAEDHGSKFCDEVLTSKK